ncbi:MAG: AraC family transcriptional regulator [Ferruginibacter sp.]|nr:AraC family transcriptional regulator [Ferruginibacter sp.]
MKPPFEILLPGEKQEYRGSITPPNSGYRIPFADTSMSNWPSGAFLTQSANGEDYWIALFSWTIQTDSAVSFLSLSSVISFMLVLKGNLALQFHEMSDRSVREGFYSCIYVPKGKHRLVLNKGEHSMLVIIPPTYYLQSMAAEHAEIKQLLECLAAGNTHCYMPDQFAFPRAVLRMLRSMEKCNKKGAALDLVLRSYMLKFLSFYNQQLKEKDYQQVYQSKEQVVYAIKEYILANLSNITLGRTKELTRQFPITPKTLTREFKKLVGKTVPEFIRHERLSLAHHLLSTRHLQVQEVALETGYDYLSHFSREFKKKFGYAPGKVKKTATTNSNPH